MVAIIDVFECLPHFFSKVSLHSSDGSSKICANKTWGWESEDDGGDQKVHCKYGIDFVEFQERAEVMLRLLHKRLPRLMGHSYWYNVY
ncbi:hypothetical protein ACET3Z_007199 [Daucus carota]